MTDSRLFAILLTAAILHSGQTVTASTDTVVLPQFEKQYLAAIQPIFGCPDVDIVLSKLKDSFMCSDVHVELKKIESSAPRGTILKQIPAAGSGLDNLKEIYFRVSDGLEVPNVVDMSLAAAQDMLSKRGIPFLHRATQMHLGIPAGRIVHQVPAPSTRLDASRQVLFLDVSRSPGVRVPDLRGLILGEANKKIRRLGLVPSHTSIPSSVFQLCGESVSIWATVLSTKPSHGTYVVPGSKLHLSVKIHERRSTEVCGRGGMPL